MVKRGWAAQGFSFSGPSFPHLEELRDSGNLEEADVTVPTG